MDDQRPEDPRLQAGEGRRTSSLTLRENPEIMEQLKETLLSCSLGESPLHKKTDEEPSDD